MISDDFLAKCLQRLCYKVESEDSLEDFSKAGFYWLKIPCENVKLTHHFCSQGFKVVDVNVTFEGTEKQIAPPIFASIRTAQSTDEKDLMDCCENFKYDRFHLDPKVPKDFAIRYKQEWVNQYLCSDRGELSVAEYGGQVIGFCAKRFGVIELIATRNGFERRGVASKLIESAFEKKIKVGTQVANIPSMRLYEKLGFRIIESKYVLHLWKS